MHRLSLRPVLAGPDLGPTDPTPGGSAAQSRRAGALGVALRHFTDQLRGYRPLHAADLHSVTAVLTKQIESLLGAKPELSDVAELLVDPERVALPDRTTAAELLGAQWPDFVADVAAQVASTRAFVGLHGFEPMLSLSAWYGVSDEFPWWGTDEWTACVDAFAEANRPSARLHELLHDEPEVVDHLTLSRVLHTARRHQWSAPLADRRPIPA